MSGSTRCVFLIGGGNMATAIIAGLDRQRWRIIACEIVPEKRVELEQQFHIETVGTVTDPKIHDANVILFAVKPQNVGDVLNSLKDTDLSSKTIISIMAGIPLSTLQSGLKGNGLKYVRTMPNTPLMVNKGVTGVYSADETTHQVVKDLLGATSKIFFVDTEDDLNKVTALSGSGPAYFFAFMEALRDAAEEMGFNRQLATEMAIGTCLGAATLAESSSDDLSRLRENVTSKGGTTEQALNSFKNDNLDQIVKKAAQAALARSRELAKQYSSV